MQKLKKLLGNKFFNVTFLKKDGSLRTMTARLGVSKGVKGTGKPRTTEGLLVVNEQVRNDKGAFTGGQFRSLYIDKIQEIKFKGSKLTGKVLKDLLA
jgi:hypothetical protein